jgi:nucleoside-diphosphate-sugar epimerase
LFWDLYHKAEKAPSLTLFGTGKESRDFIHVHDLVRVIDLVSRHASFEADVINVANGEEISIQDAASIFFSFFDSPVHYTFSGESRKGDPINWRADISILRSFGYQPVVEMAGGLADYLKWIKTT